MLQIDRRIFTHFDYITPLLVIPVIALSYYLISEASIMLATKQLVYFSIGLIAFCFFFLFPIRKLEWIIPFVYWINIILLFSVDKFGSERLGAQRWLEIPFVHFTLQPSETFKPAFLLMIAYLIRRNPPGVNGYNWKEFGKISIFILLPFILILKQPDLGTALVLLLVGYGILFIIGVKKKIWITIFLGLVLIAPILYSNIEPYQKKRITDFLSEKPSHQVQQSIIAIGSGGLYGKPATQATQTHSDFLPISTSDFIFAYHVERFGFWGGIVLVGIYILLIMHLMSLFYVFKKDYFGQVVSIGIAFFIFLYASVNIAMTIGLAPVVGLPLPFFSYGGSSFITFMVFFGILQNLTAFRFDPSYKSVKYKI